LEKKMAKKALASAKRKAVSPMTAAKPLKSPKKVPAKKTSIAKASVNRVKPKTSKSTPSVALKPKKRTPAKPAAARLRNTVDGYVSTLNDWRKDCVAGLRTMIRKAAPLLSGTGNKMRHIKLSSLKDLGKKELQELVRLAAKLNDIKGSPTRRPKGKTKHK
jgi:hypothetical protein